MTPQTRSENAMTEPLRSRSRVLDLIAGIQADLDRLKGHGRAAAKIRPGKSANKMRRQAHCRMASNAATACSTRARAVIRSPAR